MTSRIPELDVLRCIGLLGIILAHVDPPQLIFQLRNFDVPLMVFLSGYLFSHRLLAINSFKAFTDYLLKRFVRLVVPVWIFLTLFYSIQYFYPAIFPINYTAYPQVMLSSYLLWEGFGYVWVIRIFLFMAILGPIFARYFRSFGAVVAFYAVYELLCWMLPQVFTTAVYSGWNKGLLYTLGFLILFIWGSWYPRLQRKTQLLVAVFSFFVLSAGFIYTVFLAKMPFDIGSYKYPPHLYYMHYAILLITLLFSLKKYLSRLYNPFVGFIGSSTIWIYLWHILWLLLLPNETWYYRFMLVFGLACFTTYIQQQFVLSLIRWFSLPKKVSDQLLIIFNS